MEDLNRTAKAISDFYNAYDPSSPATNEARVKEITSILSPTLNNKGLAEDTALVEVFSQDIPKIRMFKECYAIISRIQKDVESRQLGQDLDAHVLQLGFDYELLELGNSLFFQALQTHPKFYSEEQTKKQGEIFYPVPPFYIHSRAAIHSSILQLYIALVFMRGDKTRWSLNANTPKSGATALNNVRDLFNHDIVRHLRNALAHGNIRPTITGLFFKDKKFEAIAPPKILDDFCLNLYGFYYVAFSLLHMKLHPSNGISSPDKIMGLHS